MFTLWQQEINTNLPKCRYEAQRDSPCSFFEQMEIFAANVESYNFRGNCVTILVAECTTESNT